MKTLRAWWLGFIESNEMYGTHLDSLREIEAYDRGRRCASLLSFGRRFR